MLSPALVRFVNFSFSLFLCSASSVTLHLLSGLNESTCRTPNLSPWEVEVTEFLGNHFKWPSVLLYLCSDSNILGGTLVYKISKWFSRPLDSLTHNRIPIISFQHAWSQQVEEGCFHAACTQPGRHPRRRRTQATCRPCPNGRPAREPVGRGKPRTRNGEGMVGILGFDMLALVNAVSDAEPVLSLELPIKPQPGLGLEGLRDT